MVLQVLVSGGGIGGLAAALALHARGLGVRVFESARAMKSEVGAGINLQPHAVKVLFDLGLEKELLQRSCSPKHQAYYTRFGELITAVPKGLAAGHEAPQISIHRGVLHQILYEAFLARAGQECLHTGTRVERYSQTADAVTVHASRRDGSGEDSVDAVGDVLIAADGIHSPVRASLATSSIKPSGVTMFRGVTTSAPFLDGETMILSGNSQLKLVIYPIQWSESSSALQLINWVAEVDGLSDAGEINYGAKIDDAEQVLKHFVRFDLPFLNHAQLIKSTRHIFVWPMVDCDPLASWVQGRVALLGDAAHPMYPIGSNGGSTAIQDAAAIAELLSTAGSDGPGIEAALVEYQQQRLPVVSDVQHACRLMLPEKVMDEVEHRVARGTTIPARYGENLQIALRLAQKGRT